MFAAAAVVVGPAAEDYSRGGAAAADAVRASLRDHRGGRWRARRQQSCPVSLQREDKDAPKIDALEAHWRDVVQDLRVNLPALRSPAFQGRLHLMRVPGHYQIRDQRERP